MQWELVVALVIAIPVILFPAVFVWYLNIGGGVCRNQGGTEGKGRSSSCKGQVAPNG